MTINYTTLLGLAQPVTGTEQGTWGDTVNTEITALLEDAIADAATFSVTSGDVTLTSTAGQANQARMAILLVTGTPGVSRNIIAPSQSKWYIVKNSSDASVVLKGSATTGVTILAGTEALCFWNGSDFEIVGVNGPSSSTDNAVVRFDSTTGKVIQNSGVIIDDSNNVSGMGTLGVGAITTTGVFTATAGTVSAPAITTTGDTNTGIYFPAADTIAFAEGGTESLRLNSSSQVAVTAAGSASTPTITKADDLNTGIFFPAADTIAFAEGGVEAMRIDSSGNVGINTTSPSAKLEIYNGNVKISDGNRIIFGSADPQIWGNSGVLTFRTNGSDRMYLDTSGNLGIGTSSPSGKLHVSWAFGSPQLYLERTGSATGKYSFGTASNALFITDEVAAAERMRINSSGNVGIGTTNPAAGSSGATRILNLAAGATAGTSSLTFGDLNAVAYVEAINGSSCALNINSGNYIAFGTGSPTERMRINSSGQIAVGATSNPWSSTYARSIYLEAGSGKPGAIAVGTASWTSGRALWLTNNAYTSSAGTWKYVSSAGSGVGLLAVGNDSLIFSGAASGTADTDITFTTVFDVARGETLALQGASRVSGTGITFPATQSASSDANTLDDYEEGTFTPTVVYSGTNTPVVSGATTGRYTKIGRIVSIQLWVSWNENGSTGNVTIGSLPFTALTNIYSTAVASIASEGFTGLPLNVSILGIVNSNSTGLQLYLNDNALNTVSATYTDADQSLRATFVYEVA